MSDLWYSRTMHPSSHTTPVDEALHRILSDYVRTVLALPADDVASPLVERLELEPGGVHFLSRKTVLFVEAGEYTELAGLEGVEIRKNRSVVGVLDRIWNVRLPIWIKARSAVVAYILHEKAVEAIVGIPEAKKLLQTRCEREFLEQQSGSLEYSCKQLEMWVLIVSDPDGRMNAKLPHELRPMLPLPGFRQFFRRYVVAFCKFNTKNSFFTGTKEEGESYCETIVFVPCAGWGLLPSVYCSEIYSDNLLVPSVGEELYGYPTVQGETKFGMEDGLSFARLSRLDESAFSAKWRDERCVGPGEFSELYLQALLGAGASSRLARRLFRRAFEAGLQERKVGIFKFAVPTLNVRMLRMMPRDCTAMQEGTSVRQLVNYPFWIESIVNCSVLQNPTIEGVSVVQGRETVVGGYRILANVGFPNVTVLSGRGLGE